MLSSLCTVQYLTYSKMSVFLFPLSITLIKKIVHLVGVPVVNSDLLSKLADFLFFLPNFSHLCPTGSNSI